MSESPAPAAPLQVTYRNDIEDWKSLQNSFPPGKRFVQRWGTLLVLTGFVALCCLPATVVLLALGYDTSVLAGWAVAAIFLIFGFVLVVKSWRPPDPETLRTATIELHPEYLEVHSDRGWERRDWALVARLQPTETLFILHRDDGLVYAVPRRAFASPHEEKAFIDTAQGLHERAQRETNLTQPAAWQDRMPPAVFAGDTLQVTYSTASPELAELQRGMILQPVDEAPQKKTSSSGWMIWASVFFVMVMVFWVLSRDDGRDTGLGIMGGLLLFPISALLMAWPTLALVRMILGRRQKPATGVNQTLTISPEGISLWAPRLEMRSMWEAIDAVQQNEKVVVFASNRPTPVHVYTVPKSAFPDEFEARHFAETAARYRRAASDAVEDQDLAEAPRVVSDNPYQPPLAK